MFKQTGVKKAQVHFLPNLFKFGRILFMRKWRGSNHSHLLPPSLSFPTQSSNEKWISFLTFDPLYLYFSISLPLLPSYSLPTSWTVMQTGTCFFYNVEFKFERTSNLICTPWSENAELFLIADMLMPCSTCRLWSAFILCLIVLYVPLYGLFVLIPFVPPLQFHGLLAVQSSAEIQSHQKGYVFLKDPLWFSSWMLFNFHYVICTLILNTTIKFSRVLTHNFDLNYISLPMTWDTINGPLWLPPLGPEAKWNLTKNRTKNKTIWKVRTKTNESEMRKLNKM